MTFGGVAGNNTATAAFTSSGPGTFTLDSFGSGNFAILCSSTANANTCGTGDVLDFTVSGTGIALAGMTSQSRGTVFFVMDTCGQGTATTGCPLGTGPVGATVPAPILGAGMPGMVLACGGLVAFARRRRRQLVA